MELLIVIIVLALVFDYINGFHDAANSIATIVSTKVLTPFTAVLWAAFFNFVAFFIAKIVIGEFGIANTVSKTVLEEFITLPVILSGLLAAIGWNLFTWWKGIPSSSSHTLIGGFAGAAIAYGGFDAVHLGVVLKIAAFILLAPLIGMAVATILTIAILQTGQTPSGRVLVSAVATPLLGTVQHRARIERLAESHGYHRRRAVRFRRS